MYLSMRRQRLKCSTGIIQKKTFISHCRGRKAFTRAKPTIWNLLPSETNNLESVTERNQHFEICYRAKPTFWNLLPGETNNLKSVTEQNQQLEICQINNFDAATQPEQGHFTMLVWKKKLQVYNEKLQESSHRVIVYIWLVLCEQSQV